MAGFSSTVSPLVPGSAPVASIGANTPGLPSWYLQSAQNAPQGMPDAYNKMVQGRLNGVVRSGPLVDAGDDARVISSPLADAQPTNAAKTIGESAKESFGGKTAAFLDPSPDKSRVIKAMEKSVGSAKTISDTVRGLTSPLRALIPEAIEGAAGPAVNALNFLMHPTSLGTDDMTSGNAPSQDSMDRDKDFTKTLANAGIDASGLYDKAYLHNKPKDPNNITQQETDKMNSGLLGMVSEKDLAGVLPGDVMDHVRQHLQNGLPIDDAVEMAMEAKRQANAANSPLAAKASVALGSGPNEQDIADMNQVLPDMYNNINNIADATRAQSPAVIDGRGATYAASGTQLPDAGVMQQAAKDQIAQRLQDLRSGRQYDATQSRQAFGPTGQEGDFADALGKALYVSNKGYSADAAKAADKIGGNPEDVQTVIDTEGNPQQIRNGMIVTDDGETILPRPGQFPAQTSSSTGMAGTNKTKDKQNFNTMGSNQVGGGR